MSAFKHAFFFSFFLHAQLTVLQGDIVRVAADAIVHPTNSTYHMEVKWVRLIEFSVQQIFLGSLRGKKKDDFFLAEATGHSPILKLLFFSFQNVFIPMHFFQVKLYLRLVARNSRKR
jgi:hypothetical protein